MPDGIRESLRQLRSEKGGIRESLSQIRSEPKPQPKPEVSFWDSLQLGVARGAMDYVVKPGEALMGALGHAAGGDFQPLLDIGERVGRGALETVSAFDPMGNAYEPTVASQAPRMEELRKRAEARQGETIRLIDQGLRVEESKDPSLKGRIVRGAGTMLTGAVPAIATGILSGGSIPAIAATTALQSASQPENLALNVGASVTPIPVGKMVAPILKRIRGLRGKASTAIPDTQPLPPLQGPARPTQGLPTLVGENAPTLDLGVEPSLSTRISTKGPKGSFEAELESLPLESLVTKAERTPVLETISALRKAGLLTGMKTHLKNVVGTGLFQLSEEASRIPSSIIDMTLSTVTKQRAISGPSLQAMAKSAREAATKGWKEAKEIIRQGISEKDLARLQLPQEINSGSKVLDTYVNTVFRTLNAEDRIFKIYAFRRSLEDRATSMALTELRQGVIKPNEITKRAGEIVANPSESLIAESLADSEIATFTNENLVSGAVGKTRDFLQTTSLPGGKVADFGVDMIVPFVKTPSNVIARMLDYTPVGLIKANSFKVAKNIITKAEITPEMQRQFALTFGRSSIGTGLIGLGAYLYNKGMLTGLIEDEPSKRARDQATGRIPGAIRVGDQWYQLLGIAPLGSLLAIGATLARETEQDSEDTGLLPAVEVAGQAIGEQPLLIGSKMIGESLTRPGTTGERLLGGLAGSFVPTALADVAESLDPTQRESKGIMGQFEKRIPFLRETLSSSVDVLGQPKQDLGPIQSMVDPTRATSDVTQSNPLLSELVRLDQGISGFHQKRGETIENYHERVREFGRLYGQYGLVLLNSTQYQLASDDDKREAFKLLNRRARSIVDEGDQREAPEKLNPASLFDSLHRKRQNN
jgi:hypothetical protein